MTKPYRILVTGSRDWTDRTVIQRALNWAVAEAGWERPVVVVHGACPSGADLYAKIHSRCFPGRTITDEPHPANWSVNGKRAGLIRNQHMVNLGADVALAFIRNGSRGASHTAALAEAAGIPTRRWTA